MIPIGSLVRDVDVGDIGLIIGHLVERKTMVNPIKAIRTQLVLWPSNQGVPFEMDLSAIESGWVEVLSEAR